MLTAKYLKEKECRPVVIKTNLGRCPQCQSDRSIDRPYIWYKRYGDGVNFSCVGLCLKDPMELGRRRGGAYPDLLRSPIRDYWGREKGPPRGLKG
ncbi:hypothetical protein TNCV_1460921 [Trichonephila clavipes]|nr:hypothetical protein TNCV_1460921 [Trichonephila clavipes]